ncbi:MAG TPA: DUF547 domain-containing protein [Burkholderiales bacterium]|nr:DUF547 domain-containing protein [Burkholderiales bacterium]
MIRLAAWLLLLVTGVLPAPARAAFDHGHAAWDRLLKRHVVWVDNGTASRVDYAGFQRDRAELKRYLEALAAVPRADFDAWPRAERLAFLINAYNAFTVELILTEYPGKKSIKDYGSLIRSPWKKSFFTLLGRERHLDDIEHGMIRAPGAYDEPRIHMAVVCASIGCPALRDEAFTAARLEAQLEDGVTRFLSDRSRNRYDAAGGTLEVSAIFDWYGGDFAKGPGYASVKQFLGKHAGRLADAPADRERVRSGQAGLSFLPYDWNLNDTATLKKPY